MEGQAHNAPCCARVAAPEARALDSGFGGSPSHTAGKDWAQVGVGVGLGGRGGTTICKALQPQLD